MLVPALVVSGLFQGGSRLTSEQPLNQTFFYESPPFPILLSCPLFFVLFLCRLQWRRPTRYFQRIRPVGDASKQSQRHWTWKTVSILQITHLRMPLLTPPPPSLLRPLASNARGGGKHKYYIFLIFPPGEISSSAGKQVGFRVRKARIFEYFILFIIFDVHTANCIFLEPICPKITKK